MFQHGRELTSIREGQRPILDALNVTREETEITNLEYLSPLGKRDHVVLSVRYILQENCVEDSVDSVLIYNKADFPAIQNRLRSI